MTLIACALHPLINAAVQQPGSISFVSLCDLLFRVGGKGRWNASVLAQKAQVGTRVPPSCASHRSSAAQVVSGRVPRSRSLQMYLHSRCDLRECALYLYTTAHTYLLLYVLSTRSLCAHVQACAAGHMEVVRVLVAAGAVNGWRGPSEDPHNAFCWAAENGQMEVNAQPEL
jgi:hypothetical protein